MMLVLAPRATVRTLSAVWAMAATMACSAGLLAAHETPTLHIEVLARAVAPGELVRIRAHVSEPVESVAGSFLGRELTFLPERADASPTGGALDWSAWSLVDLDQDKAVSATVNVSARTASAGPLRSVKSVRVVPKKFPTQKLSVDAKYVSPPPVTQERIARERAELASIFAHRSVAPLPRRPFVRPVPGVPTSVFGARRVLNGKVRDPHPGLDLKAAEGTPVVAAGPGRVVVSQELYFSGGTVVIDHGGGLFTVYAHLSRIDVAQAAMVLAGQALGLSGATGRVTGPHLHWGAKIGDLPFDPTALLDARLFPWSAARPASGLIPRERPQWKSRALQRRGPCRRGFSWNSFR